MAATGNITEDLEAIHELVRPGTYGFEVYERDGLVPWSPPATEDVIEAALARLPELPDEVVEIFRVSANVEAAALRFQDGFDGVQRYSRQEQVDHIGCPIFFSNGVTEFVEHDGDWVPDGDFLHIGLDVSVATGGPHTGIVYLAAFEGWQRVAYRLSDVIACTRELYENGWFEHWGLTGLRDTTERYNVLYGELVVPAVQRWHCSPRVATVMRHVEPSRPPDV